MDKLRYYNKGKSRKEKDEKRKLNERKKQGYMAGLGRRVLTSWVRAALHNRGVDWIDVLNVMDNGQ